MLRECNDDRFDQVFALAASPEIKSAIQHRDTVLVNPIEIVQILMLYLAQTKRSIGLVKKVLSSFADLGNGHQIQVQNMLDVNDLTTEEVEFKLEKSLENEILKHKFIEWKPL